MNTNIDINDAVKDQAEFLEEDPREKLVYGLANQGNDIKTPEFSPTETGFENVAHNLKKRLKTSHRPNMKPLDAALARIDLEKLKAEVRANL